MMANSYCLQAIDRMLDEPQIRHDSVDEPLFNGDFSHSQFFYENSRILFGGFIRHIRLNIKLRCFKRELYTKTLCNY